MKKQIKWVAIATWVGAVALLLAAGCEPLGATISPGTGLRTPSPTAPLVTGHAGIPHAASPAAAAPTGAPNSPSASTPSSPTFTPTSTSEGTATRAQGATSFPTPTVLPTSERKSIFEDVWNTVNQHYLYPDFHGANWKARHDEYLPTVLAATTDAQFYDLVGEMVGKLNDDHSTYLSPQDAREQDELFNGNIKYVGVGIYAVHEKDSILINYVFPNSPAAQAGLARRDKITAIDGKSYVYSDTNASAIRGPEGSLVTLTVKSPGQAPRDLTLKRRTVTGDITAQARRLSAGPSIGYLIVPSLSTDDMKNQVANELKALQSGTPLKGLIIDLRANGGGYRDVLISILGQFVQGNVGTFFSQTSTEPLHVTPGSDYDALKGVPLVVLVDKSTESYAEVLAGSLQGQHRARVVGTTSAGNTETIYPYNMKDGSRLWIAEEGFKLPDGTNLEGRGVIPDFPVNVDWTAYTLDNDPQILKAVELLKQFSP